MWTAGCAPRRCCNGPASPGSSTMPWTWRCRVFTRSARWSPRHRNPPPESPAMTTVPDGQWRPAGPTGTATSNGATPHPVTGRANTGRAWLRNAMAALAVLAAAAAVVSWDAQYVMVSRIKRTPVIAALEAGVPDVGAVIFAALGIALALHGRRALRPRILNVACIGISLAMNGMAAGRGWRNMAIWVMPAAVYALASDTLIGVVRAWALARMDATGPTLADEEVTPLAVAGACLLWLLRLMLAPVSTLAGFRRWVVEECPVAPGRKAASVPPPPFALQPADSPPPRPSRRRADGKPRKQDLLIALASQRHDLRT